MVVQGLKDAQQTCNYSATTSRWGQRLVAIIAVQFRWRLVSADEQGIPHRGLTFKELFDGGAGTEMRKVHFQKDDAPRMWSLALSRVLSGAGMLPARIDPQLHVKHNSAGELLILLSVHVDDLKMTGKPDEVDALLAMLNKEFDQLKLEVDNFTHLGIKHQLLEDGSRQISQGHYVAELRPFPEEEEARVDEQLGSSFRSLLAGIAWTVQTRPDVARGSCRRLESPWSPVAVSDSAYKSDGVDCLTMRSGLVLLMHKFGIQVGTNHCQLVNFVAKKQKRVCRSTYMFSLLDLLGHALNINLTLKEVLHGRHKLEALEEIHEDSVASVEVKTPTDSSAFIHMLEK
ncbi:unnamed protein product [Effrenium voratum]|nr:unnamed protein product [Effrenium voratum]